LAAVDAVKFDFGLGALVFFETLATILGDLGLGPLFAGNNFRCKISGQIK